MGTVTRITGSFVDYCTSVTQLHKKNLFVEKCYGDTEVCLLLYKRTIKEMGLKVGCFVDFFDLFF